LKQQKRINRPKCYYESDWMQISSVSITELIIRSAYSDAAAMTSCSRWSLFRSCELRQIE